MLVAAMRERSEDDLVWLLRYRTRRRIILAIGDAGRISATALRDTLKISTGSLYYNLRQLRGFVAQDKDRNYVLTEDGMKVYRALKEKGTVSAEDLTEADRRSRAASILSGIFFPIWLYTPLYEQRAVALILPALGFAFSSALLIYTRQTPILFHFYPARPDALLIAGTYFLNILAIYCLSTLISLLLSGALFRGSSRESLLERVRRVAWASPLDEAKFIGSLMVACLPLMLYPAILSIEKLFHLGLIPAGGTPLHYQVVGALLTASQVIALPFLTALIAYGRRLGGAAAALAALMIFFISHVIYQMLVLGAVAAI